MTAEEFQDALEKLDATPARIAKLIGVDIRTVRRWSTGAKVIPDTVAAQLGAIIEAGGLPSEADRQSLRNNEQADQPVSRFVWVQRRESDPHWTVAEHDLVSDVFYLPGRVERFVADELVIGLPLTAPE
ncbi:helix-turn-helix domain-containing protein [Ancylobacter vacuolatus]|uniref:Uncharacterized protein n=1 Tax=Ancylobacter vacuolatus TaxID=223389 RepID=A0ABU0DCI5_9HYPH|nr:hypothetical protein [Ancylobacter vacuolatus]MDQ0346046.1 hypothetical protein [Ancylobacter vacuolatus]